ncbi:Predicted arabinose efflux permease, MFS family [Rhizobiales bacterium GAS188]|nr:Predicted arabinose efflux permease, MFS family [Rhizobiales bacterium GAS188]
MSKLIWLTLGAFVIGTEAFVIAGLLPDIAQDLGQSIAMTGHLVTLFALAYAVGTPIMAVATGAVERKRLLVASLSLFALANLVAAIAPNFVSLIGARLLLALTAGTFMPAASAYAALSVGPERRGRAISLVYGGMTLATVLGLPLGTSIGQALGWRATFVSVAILTVLAVIGILIALPKQAAPPAVSLAARIAVARRGEVLSILALTALCLSGAFVMFTYIAPFLQGPAGFAPGTLPLILMAFGVAGAIGNIIAGYAGDLWDLRKYIATLLVILTGAFAFLSFAVATFEGSLAQGLVILGVVVWGVAGWGIPAAQQTRLVKLEPQQASVLISLNASALYLGTALGATLGAVTITYVSVSRLGFVAACMEALAVIVLVLTSRRRALPQEAAACPAAKASLSAAPSGVVR